MAIPLLALGVAEGVGADGVLETGLRSYHFNTSFATGYALYAKGFWAGEATNDWSLEAVSMDRFEDTGTYLVGGNVHRFSAQWFSTLFVGRGSGINWPKLRVDATVYRKWFTDQSLVTGLGVGHYDAPEGGRDRWLLADANIYLPGPWIVQTSLTLNRSDPGGIASEHGLIALTHLRPRDRQLTLSLRSGDAGYIDPGSAGQVGREVGYAFTSIGLNWRQWWGPGWGTQLGVERYMRSAYDQTSLDLGVFREF